MKIAIGAQQGSILVTSILLMLVMTLMGVGLTHTVSLRVQEGDKQRSLTGALLAAESCVYEQMQWLEDQTARPSGNNNNPLAVTQTTLINSVSSNADLAALTAAYQQLTDDYRYSCSVDVIVGECVFDASSGVGGNVGSTGSGARRFCYLINSVGGGGGQQVSLAVTVSRKF